MATNIVLAILTTSIATYLSRFLGVVSSEKIKETSKIFRWFNCLAYSTLAALISRVVIFPSGALSETDYLLRFLVITFTTSYNFSKLNDGRNAFTNSGKPPTYLSFI